MRTKIYLVICLMLINALATFGFLLPFLFSYKGNLNLIGAGLIMILFPMVNVAAIKYIAALIKKEKQKKCSN
jgi:hypothetical protein